MDNRNDNFRVFKRNGENVDAFGTADSLHFELSEMIGYSDCWPARKEADSANTVA